MSRKHLFTCKNCGSHELRVVVETTFVESYSRVLDCTCQAGESSAARLSYRDFVTYREEGLLDEEHRWEVEEKEEVDRVTEPDEEEIHCFHCFKEAEEYDWDLETEEPEEDETEVFVLCDGCAREIEFGWSHPDRGGRIWPAECRDFNPWKCWPEPRYLEAWRERNWLRPRVRCG